MKWDLGSAMCSPYDDDGFLGIQCDEEGEQQSGVTAYETLMPLGLMSRPMDPAVDAQGNPDPAKSCVVLKAIQGGLGYAMPVGDPRVTPNLPACEPGEAVFFQPGPCGQFIKQNLDGSITMWTTSDGTPKGLSQGFYFGPKGLRIDMPFGRLVFDQSQFTVAHKNAGRFSMKYIGGCPLLPSSMTSFVSVSASSFQATCSLVSLGSSLTGNTSTNVRYTEFAAFMGSLATTLGTLGISLGTAAGALASVQTGVITPPTQAALSGAATALGTAVTELSALALAIPGLVVQMQGATASP